MMRYGHTTAPLKLDGEDSHTDLCSTFHLHNFGAFNNGCTLEFLLTFEMAMEQMGVAYRVVDAIQHCLRSMC